MAFTYSDFALTSAGVTRYPDIEAQIANMDDSSEIETFIEFIGASRNGGAAITTTINTAAEYASLMASWHGYKNIKK